MKRYNVGDGLVYGITGVVEIVDIRYESITGEPREYYVLTEYGSKGGGYTFVPTNSEKLVGMMRPLIAREEAMRLIESASALPELEWSRDNRVRNEKFRKVMESGDHEKMISMIKTIYLAGKKRSAEGKKNYLSDEHAMHKAEKLLYSELGIVLGIEASAVPEFIAANC